MDTFSLPLRALLDPAGALPLAVERRKWLIPMLLLMLAAAASGVAVALRLDASRIVIPKMELTGELAKASEREISEQIEQTTRVGLVGGVAKAVILMPLQLLLLGLVLKIVAWVLGKKSTYGAVFTAAVLSTLPLAVFHLLTALAAFHSVALSPAMVESLLPTSLAAVFTHAGPRLTRVLSAVDAFNLWSAMLLGLGFASATQMKPVRGVLLGVFLYALFASAVFVGLPGLMTGGPGGGMGGPK